MRITQFVIEALSHGSVYALLALAVSLSYTATRTLGLWLLAIVAPSLMVAASVSALGKPPWIAVAAGLGAAIAIGLAVDAIAGLPSRRRGNAGSSALAAGFGALALVAAIPFSDSTIARLVPEHAPFDRALVTGPSRVVAVLVCSVLVLIVTYTLSFTRYGLAARALAEDPSAARAAGVNAGAIVVLVTMLATLLSVAAAIGGIVDGTSTAAFVLCALLIGGLTSPSGAVVGGFAAGIVEIAVGRFEPQPWALAAVLALSLVIAALRPNGLLPSRALRGD